jgi:glycosyltransferase involved in cell wall biosynthesis
MADYSLSFVIPLYNSAQTIGAVVKSIQDLTIEGGHEIILVNDGSQDETDIVARALVASTHIPVTYISHARNFGEHNAVLTGWRHATGRYVVNLDDDGQNPPLEAVRLWQHAKAGNYDVVYGHYIQKEHSVFRNLGSYFTNRITDWALEKPRGLYLSSFRCVSQLVVKEVIKHTGPYPYVDGLILQVTQRLSTLDVKHESRKAGSSGYTLGKLIKLWLSAWINFSVMPLRLATLSGITLASVGVLGFGLVVYLYITQQGPAFGWGSLMAALLVFSGVQLIILGLIGEYIGRMFISVNERPQSVVRDVITRS